MYVTSRVYTRPSTEVSWHNNPFVATTLPGFTEFLEVDDLYLDKKTRVADLSDDELTLTITVTWQNQSDAQAFFSNSKVELYLSSVYNYYISVNGTVSDRAGELKP